MGRACSSWAEAKKSCSLKVMGKNSMKSVTVAAVVGNIHECWIYLHHNKKCYMVENNGVNNFYMNTYVCIVLQVQPMNLL